MLMKGRGEETTRQHAPIVLTWTLELSRELSIRSFHETPFVTVYDSTLAPLLSVRYHGASSLHAPLLTDGILHAADDRLTTTIVPSRQLSRKTACSPFALDTPCTPSQYTPFFYRNLHLSLTQLFSLFSGVSISFLQRVLRMGSVLSHICIRTPKSYSRIV
jgi:hypothetical protein